MAEEDSFRTEIRDYQVEFDGEEPADVNSIQAAMLIRDVLVTLDVPFKEITVKQIVKYVFEATKGDVTVEFVGEEPEYWYAEADIREKVVEVGIDNHRMRIPLMTILMWFSKEEKEDMR
ncbi:hypothetical protein ES702_00546 [subsurface metagenome]